MAQCICACHQRPELITNCANCNNTNLLIPEIEKKINMRPLSEKKFFVKEV